MNKPTTKTDTYWEEYDGLFKSSLKEISSKLLWRSVKVWERFLNTARKTREEGNSKQVNLNTRHL